MASLKPHKGPCWCFEVEIPRELLDQIPEDRRRQACLCPNCAGAGHHPDPTECEFAGSSGDFPSHILLTATDPLKRRIQDARAARPA